MPSHMAHGDHPCNKTLQIPTSSDLYIQMLLLAMCQLSSPANQNALGLPFHPPVRKIQKRCGWSVTHRYSNKEEMPGIFNCLKMHV